MITDEQIDIVSKALSVSYADDDTRIRKALEAYEQAKWIDIKNHKPATRHIVMNSNNVLAYFEDNKWKGVDGFVISPNAKYWQPLPVFNEVKE